MLVLKSTINILQVFAFILENALHCELKMPVVNGENITQYYVFLASNEVLSRIAEFCVLRHIPYDFIVSLH